MLAAPGSGVPPVNTDLLSYSCSCLWKLAGPPSGVPTVNTAYTSLKAQFEYNREIGISETNPLIRGASGRDTRVSGSDLGPGT